MDSNTFRSRFDQRPLQTLDACGVPRIDPDAKYVDLPFTLLYSRQLNANQILNDERRQVPSIGDFYVCAISGSDTTNVRFLWPDGRFSSNAKQPSSNMYGLGTARHVEDPPRLCPRGSYIGIEIQETTGAATGIVIAFEGFVRVYYR